ncbi:MAG: iron ABC transporter permease [Spirochaetales bacterium]|nr:iron ABC transporter permease [Spirochaetales bacterium]
MKAKSSDFRTIRSYRLSVLFIFLLLLGFTSALSIAFGSTAFTPEELLEHLLLEQDSTKGRILLKIRLPRALAAGLVGCSMALSGCILQGIMRNPLASPNIIGVSSGAGLAAVIIFILFPGFYYLVTPMAFIGAFFTTLVVYSLSWKDGASPLRLVLSGIAVSSFLNAGSHSLMIFYPDRIHNVIGFMVGSLTAITWQDVMTLWPYAIAGGGLSFILAGQLNILTIGDETATGLGVNVERIRMLFIMIASVMAAAAVSVVGLLGFVGLIVPHLARLIIGNNARYLIPASMLLGAIIVILCDLIGRVIMAPLELPVGIVMAFVGAPFFIFLLRKDGIKTNRKNHGH